MSSREQNFSVDLRPLRLFGISLALCTTLFCTASLSAQQGHARSRDLNRFLTEEIHFKAQDFADLQRGEIITRLLDSPVGREIAVFGIVRINASMKRFLELLPDAHLMIETTTAIESGTFSSPPAVSDLAGLTLDPDDFKAIMNCKIGDCDIKLSAETIREIQKLLNDLPDGTDPAQVIITALRKRMVGYVASYITGGNQALATYYDKKKPLRLVDEFHDMLRNSPYLYNYQPEFHHFLENYPASPLPGTKDFIHWAKEDIGANKRVISLIHMILYRPPKLRIADALIASKQIYASHYFEASLGITALAHVDEPQDQPFYLIHLNRSRIDVLRHVRFGFLKNKIKKGVVKLLRRKMSLVKQAAEKEAAPAEQER